MRVLKALALALASSFFVTTVSAQTQEDNAALLAELRDIAYSFDEMRVKIIEGGLERSEETGFLIGDIVVFVTYYYDNETNELVDCSLRYEGSGENALNQLYLDFNCNGEALFKVEDEENFNEISDVRYNEVLRKILPTFRVVQEVSNMDDEIERSGLFNLTVEDNHTATEELLQQVVTTESPLYDKNKSKFSLKLIFGDISFSLSARISPAGDIEDCLFIAEDQTVEWNWFDSNCDGEFGLRKMDDGDFERIIENQIPFTAVVMRFAMQKASDFMDAYDELVTLPQ